MLVLLKVDIGISVLILSKKQWSYTDYSTFLFLKYWQDVEFSYIIVNKKESEASHQDGSCSPRGAVDLHMRGNTSSKEVVTAKQGQSHYFLTSHKVRYHVCLQRMVGDMW